MSKSDSNIRRIESSDFKLLKKKKLVVVVENFGLNFSGGSRATAMFLYWFEMVFDEIIVFCSKLGRHNLKHPRIISYQNQTDLKNHLDALSKSGSDNYLGYGEFYIAKYFIPGSIPFFFSYHDNWPEQKRFNLDATEMADDRIKAYTDIFKHARCIFSVSQNKLPFIKQFSKKTALVRNGISQGLKKNEQRVHAKGTLKILMAGNIDQRKYSKAIEVFDQLERMEHIGIQVDVFGHTIDSVLANKLANYSFVDCKGFCEEITFSSYDVYLNTSLIENLSLSVVDALANFTPVVSFEVGGIAEVVNSSNGRLVDPFDVKQMANILVSLRNSMFKFSMPNLFEFNWERSAIKMLDIMEEGILNDMN